MSDGNPSAWEGPSGTSDCDLGPLDLDSYSSFRALILVQSAVKPCHPLVLKGCSDYSAQCGRPQISAQVRPFDNKNTSAEITAASFSLGGEKKNAFICKITSIINH